jgi:hypothetical protein
MEEWMDGRVSQGVVSVDKSVITKMKQVKVGEGTEVRG